MSAVPSAPASASSGTADTPEVLARFRAELDLVDVSARQIARRLAASAVTLDDLRSFGREGLLHAARSFDEARGVPFRRWANLRIRGAIIDGVRQWGQLPRRVYSELRALAAADEVEASYVEESAAPAATAQAADARLTSYLAGMATAMAVGVVTLRDDIAPDGSGESPEDLTASAELLAHVKAIVQRLPESERTLIERHYFGDETLDQAAASLGLSKSWGSRLHARAIERIAKEIRNL
ncbi:MAG TPA: sigma-70 family RNA polymerase sigma factor [Polyangiaceae bacterium]|jgi:RNA polymerase sigma factor for flagellar operon FliA|nr:sigma-70 family RNA polymerase sigma factor [Polyangiaceae bacterium]